MSQQFIKKEHRYLQYLLENLFPDDKLSICIQDTSGILHSVPSLNIDYTKYRTHNGPLCTAVKTTSKGLNYCARMKSFSLNRFTENSEAFVCRCHLGLTEITKPVFIKEKLACAIYIGSFILKGDKEFVIKQAIKYSSLFGIPKDEYLKAIELTPEIELDKFQNLLNLAEALSMNIQLLAEKSSIRLTKTSDKNRVNKSSSEGIHWAVAYAMEYVDFHYNHDISLRQISRLLFMHPDYLSRIFKKYTNKCFVDYLNEKRIQEAKRIIEHSKESITTICYDVGFKNKSHFNRVFKKLCGITPSEYKKTI